MAAETEMPMKLVTDLASFIKRSTLYNRARSVVGIFPNRLKVNIRARKPDPGTPEAVFEAIEIVIKSQK
jgi:hypothetical protein